MNIDHGARFRVLNTHQITLMSATYLSWFSRLILNDHGDRTLKIEDTHLYILASSKTSLKFKMCCDGKSIDDDQVNSTQNNKNQTMLVYCICLSVFDRGYQTISRNEECDQRGKKWFH